jgi:hypothetical protein
VITNVSSVVDVINGVVIYGATNVSNVTNAAFNVVDLVILGLYRDYRLTPCSIIHTCFTDLPVIVLLLIDICYQSSPTNLHYQFSLNQ